MVIFGTSLHPGNGVTIGSGVTACAPYTAVLDRVNVPSDDLSSTEQTSTMSLDDLDIVAHGAKLLSSLFRYTVFKVNSLVKDITTVGHTGTDADTRRIKSGLWSHLEDEHIHQHLDVSLRLHETTHDTVDRVQALICLVGDQSRNDGVVRTLVRSVDVGVVGWLEHEVAGTVLEGETTALGDNGSTETSIVGVDE
jgi:hypothetical protein